MRLMVMATVMAFATGCATLKDASDAKGSGKTVTYNAPFDMTWDAVLQVVEESKLDLIAKDKEDGKILAQKGVSAFSYGENVAIFVEPKDDASTVVEVISKRALSTNLTARNWGGYIHEEISKKLK